MTERPINQFPTRPPILRLVPDELITNYVPHRNKSAA